MCNYLLCCDWGTTSFRLGLYNLTNDKLVGEIHTKDGVASTHKVWQSIKGDNEHITRLELFRQQLSKHIRALSDRLEIDAKNIPLVISGMASSSIGMEDVPYAELPFPVNGSRTSYRFIEASDEFPHVTLLISGVKGEGDVMRGEETQLMGLFELLKSRIDLPQDVILIFPGTHSKHIHVQNGQLTDFKTFMTGEIFHAIINHSILKDSVQPVDQKSFAENDIESFKKGLKNSDQSNVLNSLFAVRTNQLFGKLSKRENFFYLSGLLIGSEINHLLKTQNCRLLLCSGSNLYRLYSLALEELDYTGRSTTVPIEVVDRSALVGQVLIYRKHFSNLKVQ